MTTKFKPGDRVKYSDHALKSLRDSWLSEGREPMKTRKRGWLDDKAAKRGTVLSVGESGVDGCGINVKFDDEDGIHSMLPYVVTCLGEQAALDITINR